MKPFFVATKAGIKIYIKAMPGAKKQAIHGIFEGPNEQLYLKVTVTTPPEDNKANQAILRFLALSWKLHSSQFELIQGQTHRLKVIAITLDAHQIQPLLDHLRQISTIGL